MTPEYDSKEWERQYTQRDKEIVDVEYGCLKCGYHNAKTTIPDTRKTCPMCDSVWGVMPERKPKDKPVDKRKRKGKDVGGQEIMRGKE